MVIKTGYSRESYEQLLWLDSLINNISMYNELTNNIHVVVINV